MTSEPEHISVGNINEGRLAAHIDDQLKTIIADIADPNKPANVKRTLTLNISLLPSKSRREVRVEYGSTVKLAAPEKEEVYVNVGKIDGKPFASNQHIDQPVFEFKETDTEN